MDFIDAVRREYRKFCYEQGWTKEIYAGHSAVFTVTGIVEDIVGVADEPIEERMHDDEPAKPTLRAIIKSLTEKKRVRLGLRIDGKYYIAKPKHELKLSSIQSGDFITVVYKEYHIASYNYTPTNFDEKTLRSRVIRREVDKLMHL
ncbi:hypothetical protein C4573_05740 [Candidatus Woesearchaeota archaeon]|nr:MAG: hypothetical protein C4573_05740 [Candidatus Woesearchaeota archaeon]